MKDDQGKIAEILLVEDNPADLRLVQEVFREAKVVNPLRHADDAAAALEILEEGGIDLMLLDLDLPGMDGRELLAAIREKPALRHLPVVVLTGSLCEADIGRSFDLEVGGYLTKPISATKLLRVVDYVGSLGMAFVARPQRE